jgi:hypothetical protein
MMMYIYVCESFGRNIRREGQESQLLNNLFF